MLVLIILLLLFFSWLRASEVCETKLVGLDLELLNYGLFFRTTDGLICSISATEASIVCGSESRLLTLIFIDDLCLRPPPLLLAGDGDFSVNPAGSGKHMESVVCKKVYRKSLEGFGREEWFVEVVGGKRRHGSLFGKHLRFSMNLIDCNRLPVLWLLLAL